MTHPSDFRRLLLASLIGGLFAAALCVGGFAYYSSGVRLSPKPAAPASFASYGVAPDNFREAARKSMAAVVHISTQEQQPLTLWDHYYGRAPQVRQGTGSGVIYAADGYIVTNNHVIDGADAITVSLNDNRRFTAELIGTYPAADIAVLKVDGEGLPVLRFSDSDQAEVGDWVLAVGNPYNLSSTVTAGIISARGRDIGIIHDRNAIESFIQTDAAINPGNSGGALVNTQGELVGINTAIYSRTGGNSGYGFAIPANLTSRIVDDIIATGSYRQIVLGIEAGELDTEWARELQVPVSQGIVLTSVDPGGAAGLAGLRDGDVVVGAAGRGIRTIPQFREAMGSRKRGDEIELEVYRDGKRRTVLLRL